FCLPVCLGMLHRNEGILNSFLSAKLLASELGAVV
ncbi:hypothetical protein A2U01_0071148, partial [Trifolium medium]|nr:hypothetical protein [Trifolium medium]